MPKFPNDPVVAASADGNTPPVQGENTASGIGVYGKSDGGVGFVVDGGVGVVGESTQGVGVRGVCHGLNHGVVGINDFLTPDLFQHGGTIGNGGWFESNIGEGARGTAHNPDHGGVVGVHMAAGEGVHGTCDAGRGVAGFSITGQGVYGHSVTQAGVVGESEEFDGVYGIAKKKEKAGVTGYNPNPGGLAGFFDGNMSVTGDVTINGDIILTNAADCAEDFTIGADVFVEPGTVMVLGKEGALFPSDHAYDKRVVGVISGAGEFKPGIVLDKQQSKHNRQPIALLGKVYCKVDAQYGCIEIGDLLTTSQTPGYAMKANEHVKAFGSIIGKALRPLSEGKGLVPILIALQ